MMKIVAAAAVVAMGMTGIATADQAKAPTVMTDAQMDEVVAAGGHKFIAIVTYTDGTTKLRCVATTTGMNGGGDWSTELTTDTC